MVSPRGTRSHLDEWFLPGSHQAPRQRASPFFPEVHDEITKSCCAAYSSRLRASYSSALTSVDGTQEKGYDSLPPLDESVAAHFCPPTAIGWKAKSAHPSKPCRTSLVHSMAVLQVFQAPLETPLFYVRVEPEPLSFQRAVQRDRPALCATKWQPRRSADPWPVLLERHRWLNLMEMKDTDKVAFLNSPVSPTGLSVSAVEGFAECFTAAQKSSQAMRHFLPKCFSSEAASSHPKMAPTQQPAKAPPPEAQPTAKPEPLHSCLARRHPPKRQGP